MSWQDLKDLFRQSGNVLRADINLGPDGRSQGSGIILFATVEGAQNAISEFLIARYTQSENPAEGKSVTLNGYEMKGRPLEVREVSLAQDLLAS